MSFEQRPMGVPLTEEEIQVQVQHVIDSAEQGENVWPIEIEVDSWPGGREVETFYEDGSREWESLQG